MTTKFIGLKELRQGMARITRDATKHRQRLIVLRKNTPLFELRPLSKADTALLSFDREIKEARASAKSGKLLSTQDVRQMLGLKPYEV